MDITDAEACVSLFDKFQPDVLIHAAAMTQVDNCEDERETCDLINITGVSNLIKAIGHRNTHFVHISTDFIYEGDEEEYFEDSKVNPLSYYGMSKLKSEEILINSKINYTILRTILVFGKVHEMSRANIVLWVKERLEKGEEITIVNDQYRAPTYVEDLALACKISIEKKALGIFHVSSNKLLSIYEISQQIAEVFYLNKSLIKPIPTSLLNQRAIRPAKTGFDLTKTKRDLGIHSKSFKEDLQRFKGTFS